MIGRIHPSCLVWIALVAASAKADEHFESVPFIKGTDGYFAYRIPALIVSTKGTLLAFCEGRKTTLSDDGDNDLVLRRSLDGGRTWNPLQLVHEEGGNEVISIGNPCPVVDRMTGTIWLTMNRTNGRVLITHSEDDGARWSPAEDITGQASQKDWGWYALGPGMGIQIERGSNRGRMVIPANHRATKDRSGPSSSHVIYSDDHGRSWHIGGTVALHTNECQVVETATRDGSELLINARNHWARSGNKPELNGKRVVSRSRDGGLTWSEPAFDGTLIEPTCQASLVRYSFPEKNELSVLLFSNPASKSKRERMTVRVSYDEGRTWPVSKLIDAGPSAYSCLSRLPNKRIGLLYERGGYRDIVFSSFTLDWLKRE
jgi:sialidase-1